MSDKNKFFIETLFNSIKNNLGKVSLSDDTKKDIIQWYNMIDPKTFIGHKATEIIKVLTKIMSSKIVEKESLLNQSYDTHEYLKEIVNTASETQSDVYLSSLIQPNNSLITPSIDGTIKSFLGMMDIPTLQMYFNPSSLLEHNYTILDSEFRNTSNESNPITSFTWNYTETQNYQNGFCFSIGRLRDVIGMRLFQPRIPYLVAMDTSAKRVSVLIQEFKAQAYILPNGNRFHYILQPLYDSATTTIELNTNDFNDGIFTFRKPFTTFDTLTVSFGDPIDVLSFSPGFAKFVIVIEFVCIKSDK